MTPQIHLTQNINVTGISDNLRQEMVRAIDQSHMDFRRMLRSGQLEIP